MARKLIGVLALGLALAAPAVANAGLSSSWSDEQRYEPGQALVRYAAGVGAAERRDARSAADVDFEGSLSLPHTQVVSFDGSVREAIARLEDQPGVVDAQPNYVYHALAATPNDTHFGNLWGMGGTPGVGVLPAWDRSRGAGQVIAVVDTGVALSHPDLAGNLWTGPGGVHGHDFVDNDDDPEDFNLHGTHVAGTAAAIADNGQGVAGVAPQAQIMAVRVLDADGKGNTGNIANGIAFAANNGAGVINLSLGGASGDGDQAMSDAITQAEQHNAVIVAAAGNDNNNNDVNPTTPCTLPNANLICVASVTKTGARSDFSNFGATTVDVGAPGGDGSGDPNGDILSTKPAWNKVFSEDFQTGTDGWTASHVSGLDWGLAGGGIDGESITDSPGSGVDYQANSSSKFQHTAVDLTGQRGCRLDFWIDLNIDDVDPGTGDPFDFATVGLETGGPTLTGRFAGNTNDFFKHVDKSLGSDFARNDVQPTLGFESDGTVQDDGAYVDDISIVCRGDSYPDAIGGENAADGGSYTAIAGTSMASPHVAGVAALVRAVDPGAPPSQVVQAIMQGARPVAGMQGVTVTGAAADAVGAMDAALAIPNPVAKPNKPRVLSVRVSRKGVITMVVQGDAGNTGKVTLTANITAARVRTVAKKSFRLASTGRAKVKLKLSRPATKQLKRKRKLKLKAKVVVKNAAGATNSLSGRIRLSLRRR
jgi:thermitase